MSKKSPFRFTPIFIALSVVIGIMIGTFYAKHSPVNRPGVISGTNNKLSALLRIINDQYVDTIDMQALIEEAMPQILGELDPHSTYIPAKDLEAVTSELESSFSGIGIQFTIQDDTIHVNSVIAGGPSEKVGLIAGDRIVMVDDSLFVGKGLTNDRALKTLKGPKGTEVKVSIKRAGEKELLNFTITRGDIPQKSVEAAYMIDENYGYMQITKFARGTYYELISAIAKLNNENCKGVIIDLRGNTGGYMDAAIAMVNEFLPSGELIVYTEGRKSARKDQYADGSGSCQSLPVVVLIDETSASASEIFAGAIQDNDRGTIVGRRSYGKGLVQQPIEFTDGSAIRLTIARYYTPSGRSIQRPYHKGNDREYEMDLLHRYEHGEFFSEDSIKLDKSLKYRTKLKRTVYGGGGIMPDIFVPQDTTDVTSYLRSVTNRRLTLQFAFQYTDHNRPALSEFTDSESLLKHLRRQGVVEQFIHFAEKKGIKRRNIMIHKSYRLLEQHIYGNILYNMLGHEQYLRYSNQSDETVQKALQLLIDGKAFPQAPAEEPITEEETPEDETTKDRTAKADTHEEVPMLRLYAACNV